MSKGLIALLLVAGLTFAGCNSEKTTEEGKGTIEINAPGTNIKIDPENGVKVDAPGAKIETDGEGNTSVDAPGTNIDVKKD